MNIYREWQPDSKWMLLGTETTAPCRFMTKVDGKMRSCGKPAVAQMLRRLRRGGHNWWAYCGEHLYGREIRGGKVCSYNVVSQKQPQ